MDSEPVKQPMLMLTDNDKNCGDGDDLDLTKSFPERETWHGRFDFLISCIGYCIGLGNVWRFPYLCYKNGGGAFLIPYLITVALAGIPMYFLELALGQYHKKGALGIWKTIPAFKGIGYAVLVITGWVNIYYTVIMAWALWYLFNSFSLVLPWSTCHNDWNTDRCITNSVPIPCFPGNHGDTTNTTGLGWATYHTPVANTTSALADNASLTCYLHENGSTIVRNDSLQYTSSVEEFWHRHTLRTSSGIEEPGLIHWQMALILLLVWLICYFCIWKGVKWSGKIVYVTALLPYVLIIVMLGRGLSLPGAMDGVRFYLSPNMSRLSDSQVWLDASTQVFFSTGIGYGAVIVLGSYNHFNHNMYRSAIVVGTINSCTSLVTGLAIFSVLGFMAHRLGQDVSDVTESGPGLAFVAYPSALSELPGAPFWSCLFFIMLFMVGLDTQFCMMEGFFTSIIDEFPNVLRKRREVFIAVTCFLSYLIGLSMVTQGGMYVFQLFDWYSGSRICLLFVVFFEAVAIAWFYGAERFYKNVTRMIGFRPSPIFKYCWMITIPTICFGVFLFSLVVYSPVSYMGEAYPVWADVVGWCISLSSMLCIPFVMVAQVYRAKESSLAQKVQRMFLPSKRNGRHAANSRETNLGKSFA